VAQRHFPFLTFCDALKRSASGGEVTARSAARWIVIPRGPAT
jgi:hypothetical protein